MRRPPSTARTPHVSWDSITGATSDHVGGRAPSPGAATGTTRVVGAGVGDGVGVGDGAAAITEGGGGAPGRDSHGLTTATPRAMTTTRTPIVIGSIRRRFGPSLTGSKS